MNIIKSFKLSLTLLVTALLFSGCALIDKKSPDSQSVIAPKVKKPIIRKTTVYFYRPDQSISGWTWKDINIMEIHALGLITDPEEKTQVTQIGKLKNNSYMKKEFNAGTHRFTANWELLPYEFTLKPDEEMCIKAEIGFFNALQRRATFKIVDKNTCKSDINKIAQPQMKEWRIKTN